jgi:tripartite-type tricarboxylate transporter receptor subunit TctC
MNTPTIFPNSMAALRICITLALSVTAVSPGWAQAWPTKPIRLIVPFATGAHDQIARRLAEPLSAALGQPVVVENVAGASGAIALARVARAQPDGYTLVISANATTTILPHLSKLTYDARSDLQALGGRVKFAYVLVASPSETARTAAELVARSKESPAGISYGSGGVGSGAHLITERLRRQTGANFTHVPYKGIAQIQTDILGGHLGFSFDVVGTAAPLVKAGKLKALGVTGLSGSPLLPGVPTISESVPGFETLGWFAIFGPKGIPPAIVSRLNAEMAKIYRTAEYAVFFETTGYEPAYELPEELTNVLVKESEFWERLIRTAGIKAE